MAARDKMVARLPTPRSGLRGAGRVFAPPQAGGPDIKLTVAVWRPFWSTHVTWICCPGLWTWMAIPRSVVDVTVRPFTAVITAYRAIPAWAAGDPDTTL